MKNNVLYMYNKESEFDNYTVITKIGIVKESLLSSILSDIFTFGCLISTFCINAHYIHSRLLSVFIIFSLLVFVKRNTKKVKKEELLKIMNEALDS